MPTKTWYATSALADVHQALAETDPGAEDYASPRTGWTVATGTSFRSKLNSQVKQASGQFNGNGYPSGSPDVSIGDCLRTPALRLAFAAGTWEFHFAVRAEVLGGAQDGRAYFRLLKSASPNGSSPTVISGQITGSIVTNVDSATTQDSSATVALGAFDCRDEYLFVQIAWQRTGAGAGATADILMRVGNGSGSGTRVSSPNATSLLLIGTPDEFDAALTLPPFYGRAVEADAALRLPLLRVIGRSLESDTALALRERFRVKFATESDVAFSLGTPPGVVYPGVESDVALRLALARWVPADFALEGARTPDAERVVALAADMGGALVALEGIIQAPGLVPLEAERTPVMAIEAERLPVVALEGEK